MSHKGILQGQSRTLIMKMEKSETRVERHRREISNLQTRVGYLTASSEGYLAVQRRFLDTYSRDALKMVLGFDAISIWAKHKLKERDR